MCICKLWLPKEASWLTFYVRPSSRVAWTDCGSEHVKQMSSEQNKVFCIRYFFTTVVLHTCVVLLCVIPYFQCFWGWWLPIWCTWCKVLSLSWGETNIDFFGLGNKILSLSKSTPISLIICKYNRYFNDHIDYCCNIFCKSM